MAIIIFLAFVAVPIVEIAVFIELGGRIGLWNTIGLVVLTAVIGTYLLRAQGLATLRRAQESMAQNVFPADELFDGLCLLIGGVLLLTPGFVTDSIGFLLLLPPVRKLIRAALWRHLSAGGNARVWVNGEEVTGGPAQNGTIDGDYREIDPEATDDRDPRLPR